jgi:hypothetical protein
MALVQPPPKSKKVLIGVEMIRAYLHGISPQLLNTHIKNGLPVRCAGGKLYAHADNIDRYFAELTWDQHENDY